MSRRDYELLAAAFRRAYQTSIGPDSDRTRLRHFGVTEALVEVSFALEADNPRFNRDRFIEAVQRDVTGPVRAHTSLASDVRSREEVNQ